MAITAMQLQSLIISASIKSYLFICCHIHYIGSSYLMLAALHHWSRYIASRSKPPCSLASIILINRTS